MIGIYRRIGEIDKNPWEWEMASQYIDKAMAICNNNGQEKMLSSVLSEKATLHDLRKMHSKARATFKQAIEAAHKSMDGRQEVFMRMNLGISFKTTSNTPNRWIAIKSPLLC